MKIKDFASSVAKIPGAVVVHKNKRTQAIYINPYYRIAIDLRHKKFQITAEEITYLVKASASVGKTKVMMNPFEKRPSKHCTSRKIKINDHTWTCEMALAWLTAISRTNQL